MTGWRIRWLLMVLACFSADARAQPADPVTHGRIRQEGNARSRVMDYAAELIDGIGPRLTGSPNLSRAIDWARKTLTEMGCSSVRVESWGEFGLGWRERNVWVRVTQPETAPLIARAAPWSPATRRGNAVGEVVAVRGFRDEREFEAYRGKLRGKIVLLGTAPLLPEVIPIEKPLFVRFSQQLLDEFAARAFEAGTGYEHEAKTALARFDVMEKTGRFLAAEKAVAVIVPSGNNAVGGASGGTIHVDTNYTFGWFVYRKSSAMQVPLVVMAIEHYGRLRRLVERGVPVRVEVHVDTEFSREHQQGFNLLADIAGADPQRKDEIVMVTAHLDSWASGTGATDDGAGVIIAMEAMRILRAVGTVPRRTIRLALWTGEEQGSLGSRDYVRRHVADVPVARGSDLDRLPEFMRPLAGPVRPKEEHGRLSAVYTLDAGGGRIRGVSTGNPELVPLFRGWLAPFKDLGVNMVASGSDCGGDCWSFQQVGIPVPSFRQDPLAYHSRTHHTNMDVYEHLVPADLRQAAIIVATVLSNTAMHGEMLARLPPRK